MSITTEVRTRKKSLAPVTGIGVHMDPDEYLTTEEVAAWLKVAPSTVCRWRMASKGPRVTWLSPTLPRYRRADVAAWLEKVAA
ncbi:helix-turn-helix transcriptional regulator [Promicromonospora sp. NPDC057138]|uniref:helix-turn-helix transcriptional regulator n=1 Tax=Promicromonospora sp. NPDC057138 TaxID=3346031 RepID=UPI00363383DF